MTIEELRIGNKVKCTISNDAGIYTVLAIPGWGMDGCGKDGEPTVIIDRCPKQEVGISKLRGIKLTSEILEKSGFKCDMVYQWRYSLDSFVLGKTVVDWAKPANTSNQTFSLCLDYGQQLSSQTTYVHQLQNLYNSITREEIHIVV